MAERRMFSKTLLFSNDFLEMSPGAQLLYYNLGLAADDDGFVANSTGICRACGCRKKALQELIDGGWVIGFGKKLVVIVHWHVHNQIRKDRYKPTLYQKEYAQLCRDSAGFYVLRPDGVGCQSDTVSATQDRTDKDRIDKDSIVEDRLDQDRQESLSVPVSDIDLDRLLSLYHMNCPSLEPCGDLDEKTKQQLQDQACTQPQLLSNMVSAFITAENTPFLRGEGERGWRASLPWLADPGNRRRVLEGFYASYH